MHRVCIRILLRRRRYLDLLNHDLEGTACLALTACLQPAPCARSVLRSRHLASEISLVVPTRPERRRFLAALQRDVALRAPSSLRYHRIAKSMYDKGLKLKNIDKLRDCNLILSSLYFVYNNFKNLVVFIFCIDISP
jgi:hypothetical protein